MTEINRDSVVRFLLERGGRVPNQQLVEHFRPLLSGQSRVATRQLFKDLVNEVASVRVEDGAKYVCLRKKYRRAAGEAKPEPEEETEPDNGVDLGNAATSPRGDETTAEHSDGVELDNAATAKTGALEEEPATAEDESPEESSKAGSPDSAPGEESPQAGTSPGYDTPPSISVTEDPEPLPVKLGGRTPRSSRRVAREPVSPQPRRGGGGVLLRAGEVDSSSLHSSSSVSGNEEDEGPVSLEPLEHAWMLSSCRARWESLRELLMAEPGLITRRDFITGFSCLHWAAKHGEHELLAALLTHARQHRVPVNINARASGGYTALHLAAMHGHLDVMKLLVGAYDADLDIRDYSGRKAWQYLSPDTARDVQALVGAASVEGEDSGSSGPGRWRLSRVLPTQLIVHRLSQLPEEEQDGSGRGRGDITRKGSGGGRGKPRLNRIRFRTQIIHTNLSAREAEDEDDRVFKSPMRHRPKSNVFG